MRHPSDVPQGTLALMVLRTVAGGGPLHGLGIARQIERTSRDRLVVQYGTLYPALLRLEQDGFIRGEWRPSENNRRARYYSLTPAGHRRLERETEEWRETSRIISWFTDPEPA